jgi:hypothetical protein
LDIEIRRHAEKNEKGVLSEYGKEQSQQFAQSLSTEIKEAPLGSVFAIMPSNVTRAQETRDEAESRLKEIFSHHKEIEILSVRERDILTRIAGEKRYIITGLAYSSLLGYKAEGEEKKANDYFDTVANQLEGDKLAAFKLWCAWTEELEPFKLSLSEHHRQVPYTVIESLQSENFKFTPEQYALKAFHWMERMRQITQQLLGDHYCKLIGISHDDVSDFLTFSLLGYRISIKTIELFKTLRGFIEPSSYQFKPDGSVLVTYRGYEKELTINYILDFKERVEIEKELRLREWFQNT